MLSHQWKPCLSESVLIPQFVVGVMEQLRQLNIYFLLCDVSKRIWFASPMGLRISEYNIKTFEDWSCMMLTKYLDDGYSQGLLAYILWFVWKARCTELYEHKRTNLNWVLSSAENVITNMWVAKG